MSIAEKLTTIAENQQKVYNAGYAAGQAAGGGGTDPTPTQEKTVDITENGKVEVTPDEGYALSKVTANVNVPDFWDVFQENGTRTNYEQCFNGDWWTQGRFNPKYPIVIQRCSYMFQQSTITDLSGVTIDFSQKTGNTYLTRPFDQSDIVTIGTIDLSNINGILNTIFAFQSVTDVYLETIQKLILSETNTFGTNFFQNCVKLKNITIEGTIGTSISFQWCTSLTVESMKSIILALKDFDGNNNGPGSYTQTIKFPDVCWEALAADSIPAPNGEEWKSYVQNALGWNT